ncbi:MAG: DUF3047 domain-containing protein [Deltaproteobacteria bacterium]|nr:DUF3047 domain-containing protein [Deltaproteobacteria bacterium]
MKIYYFRFNRRQAVKFIAFLCAVVSILPAVRSYSSDNQENRLAVPIAASPSNGIEGWKVKEWNGKADFEVIDTEFGKAVHLKSASTSSALLREMKFDTKKYPMLGWRWKAVRLPEGGDVRQKSTDDQAIQVYVMFSRWPGGVINRRVIGYIWDTGAPEGGVFTSAKTSSTRYIVLRSGPAGLGQWFEEKRNVFKDYERLFDEEPEIDATGISVMIDSDDTKSSAESYITGIYIAGQ